MCVVSCFGWSFSRLLAISFLLIDSINKRLKQCVEVRVIYGSKTSVEYRDCRALVLERAWIGVVLNLMGMCF